MTPAWSGLVIALTSSQQAVRDYLQKGGSVLAVLLAITGLLAVVVLIGLVSHVAQVWKQKARRDDPQRLHQDLLQSMNLRPSQRHLLDQVAQDLHIQNPSAMLLSAELFDQRLARWRKMRHGRGFNAELVARTRDALFPNRT